MEWNTQTNSAGLYVFPSLPPGNYQITITAEGFQKLSSRISSWMSLPP